MSIASEITRLQGVKADILDAIADKGVTVPAGSALADCPALIGDISGGGEFDISSIVEISPSSPRIYVVDDNGYIGYDITQYFQYNLLTVYHNFAILASGNDFSQFGLGQVTFAPTGSGVIGGRTYPTVTISNKTWIAENLDYKFSGLVIGSNQFSTTEPYGNYYNYDESTYGVSGNKYGLLYNWISANYLQEQKDLLIPGWHVSSLGEWKYLFAVVGGESIAGLKLKSTSGWNSSGDGDGTYGFNAPPAGTYYYNGNAFTGLGDYINFWTINTYSRDKSYYAGLGTGDSSGTASADNRQEYSIRLVKDPVYGTATIGGKTYKTCIIGNREWLAENLDYQFDGCSIAPAGVPSTPAAWYYNNDETTYGWNGNRCGLLYNDYAIQYLETNKDTLLPSGWRLPNDDDFDSLVVAVGGLSITSLALKCLSTTLSSSWYGANTFGMNILPAGWRGSGSDFGGLGSSGTIRGVVHNLGFDTNNAASYSGHSVYLGSASPTRLVRDLT